MFPSPNYSSSILISYGHHTFSLTYKPSNKKIILPSQPQCPYLSMSRNNFSSPPLAGDLPPLPPIVNTTVGSVLAQADLPISASVRNAHVASVGDEYSESTSRVDFDVRDEFLGNSGNPDETEITPPSGRSLFTENEPGAAQIAGGTRMKCRCQGLFWSIFRAKFLRYTIASSTKMKL